MRFQVTQVMDSIEQRLTTDITPAQAVVDLGEVVRCVQLDLGRPVNLVRVGLVVDALGRYLLDEGALLYGVVGRELLSEAGFTSKERMVVSRWADDGLIEVTTADVPDRAAEVAELTGLPLITLRRQPELIGRAAAIAAGSGQVLRLLPRCGAAALIPIDGADDSVVGEARVAPAVGRATPEEAVESAEAEATPEEAAESAGAEATAEDTEAAPKDTDAALKDADAAPTATDQDSTATDQDSAAEEGGAPAAAADQPTEKAPAADQQAEGALAGDQPAAEEAVPGGFFAETGTRPGGPIRVSRHRYLRASPAPEHSTLLTRKWHCDGFDCAAFGDLRRIGQPVPRLLDGVPVCPRHGEPLTDAGPRPLAYPISLVIDDLPRRRLVVREGGPLSIGREDSDPTVVSVRRWLHKAAASWISRIHVLVEVEGEGVTITDVSKHGSVLWLREGPDDPGTSRPLRHTSHKLRDWDSVELYTGVEVFLGDQRVVDSVRREQPASVLIDAPTAAHSLITPGPAASEGEPAGESAAAARTSGPAAHPAT